MAEFLRASSLAPRSLARARFARDLTEINDYYWGSASALAAVKALVRHLGKSTTYRETLGIDRPRFERPLRHEADSYHCQLETSSAWHRRAAVLVLSSAFDRYLVTITAIAVASDPGLEPGFPKKFDGLVALKHQLELGERNTVGVSKGDWSSRLAGYERLFGQIPAGLLRNQGDLERLRQTRNRLAHDFGDKALPANLSAHAALAIGGGHRAAERRIDSVSERALTRWFETVRSSVAAIDTHLLQDFIGGFEAPAMLIEWQRDPQSFERALGVNIYRTNRTESRNAKSFLTATLGLQNLSLENVDKMLDYIKAL